MSVLTDRITEYLSNGGLWNPESMEHIKVMILLTDCREGLNALQKQISQEEEENVSLSRIVGERGKEIQALKADNATLIAAAYEDARKLLRCRLHGSGPVPWCSQCSHIENLQRDISQRTPADARQALKAQIASAFLEGVKEGAEVAFRDASMTASQIDHDTAVAICDMQSDYIVEIYRKKLEKAEKV